jgi:hypothetical protein
MEMSGQLHAPAALSLGKDSLVPIGYEAGWVPEPFWMRWWREKFPVHSLVAVPTELLQIAQTITSDWEIRVDYNHKRMEIQLRILV